jgi:ABC-type branched-subunit amino acid transport system permease subunit
MKKWIHWFKTGEGGDERVRGINARSGLLSFSLLILLLAIRSVLVRIGFEELSSPDVDVYIIIFISAFFILINALLGASLKDEIREMKNPSLYYVIITLTGGITAALGAYFTTQRYASEQYYWFIIALVFLVGCAGGFLLGFLIRFIGDQIALAKNKKDLGEEED